MQLYRGLYPVVAEKELAPERRPGETVRTAKELGWVKEGDIVLVIHAEERSRILGTNIVLRVATVK